MFYANSPAQPYPCRQEELPFGQPSVQYPMFPEYPPSNDKFMNSAAGETRTVFHSTISSQLHPRRLFTRQNSEGSIRPLNPHLFSSYQHQVYQSSPPFTNGLPQHQWEESPQNWAQNYHPISLALKQNEGQPPYPSFPSPSLLPPNRLSPRPFQPVPFHAKGPTQGHRISFSGNRLAFNEPVELNPGLVLRPPEHPRLRTAQACEKCRVRKAKCSGEHPKCKRCCDRNLNCEYAKEGRVRGPNKPKAKAAGSPASNEPSPAANNGTSGRSSSRPRTSSAASSVGSSGPEPSPAIHSVFTTSGLDSKTGGGRNIRRHSLSVDLSAPARPPDFMLGSGSDHIRRPRCNTTTLLPSNDYFMLQQEEIPNGVSDPTDTRGFMEGKACLRQAEQHYDVHGNSLIMRSDCQVIGHSTSHSPDSRRFESGRGGQYQPGNSMTYVIHQSEFVPMGLDGHIVAQNDSVHTPDSIFPPRHGFENVIPVGHRHQEIGSAMLSSSFSMADTKHSTSPMSVDAISAIGSPLTPTSATSSVVSYLSHQKTPHLQGPYDSQSVTRSDPTFHVEAPIPRPLNSGSVLTSEPVLAQENSSPRAEQNSGLGYHPTIDISHCAQVP